MSDPQILANNLGAIPLRRQVRGEIAALAIALAAAGLSGRNLARAVEAECWGPVSPWYRRVWQSERRRTVGRLRASTRGARRDYVGMLGISVDTQA